MSRSNVIKLLTQHKTSTNTFLSILFQQEQQERAEKKKQQEKEEEERKKQQLKEEEAERKREEEEKRIREEREKQELEEYMKLKQAFSVEEEGYDEIVDEEDAKNLLQRFITHIQVSMIIPFIFIQNPPHLQL